MASVNKVLLVGHLGADPESRYLPSGTQVVNFNVATTEHWKGEDGEKKERTEWTRCSAFAKTAEVCAQYLKKGSLVYIEGRLQTNKYEKDGQTHYSTQVRIDRVQFLDGRKPAASGGDYAEASGSSSRRAAAGKGERRGGLDQMDDDIPFAPIGRGISGHAI